MKWSMKSIGEKVKGVFFEWLLSYVSILLIPIVFSGIMQWQLSGIFEREVSRVNLGMLKQVQQTMDNRLEDIENLSRQISLNTAISSLKSASKPLEDYQQYNIIRIVDSLKTYTASNTFIDDICIFLKQSQIVIDKANSISSDLYYNYFFQYDGLSYEQWMGMMNGVYTNNFRQITVKSASGETSRKIAYFHSISSESLYDNFATLVILMDEENLLEAVENIQLVSQGLVMVLDKDNTPIVKTRDAELGSSSLYESLTGESGIFYDRIKDDNVVISYIISKETGWKYVAATPVEIFWEKMAYVRRLTVISAVLCILVSGVVVIFFLRRNYNPVRNMIKMLSLKADVAFGRKRNEYHFMQEVMSKVFDDNEEINRKLKQQNLELCSNFLRKLLKGQIEDTAYNNDTLAAFDIHFSSDQFAVILFYIEDYSSFFSQEQNSGNNLKCVQLIITKVLQELADSNNQVFTTEMDNEIMACLVNFNENSTDGGKDEAYRIATETHNLIEEKFKIYSTVAVSMVHQTIAGISQAYQEAMECIEYRIVTGGGKIIFYEHLLDSKESRNSYYYPIDMEQQLINFIKSGEFSNVKEILDKIFYYNFEVNTSTSIYVARCLMFDMISTLMKTFNEINDVCKVEYLEKQSIIEDLIKCETIAQIKDEIFNGLKNVCDYILKNKKNSHQKLIDEIVVFIKSNYHNPNLGIAMIGEKFEMTPAYISTIFRDEVGEGLVNYINKLRLKKAKQLLREEKLNISEIANKTGFNSSTVFIRIFKKYEGITPGQFKEIEEKSPSA